MAQSRILRKILIAPLAAVTLLCQAGCFRGSVVVHWGEPLPNAGRGPVPAGQPALQQAAYLLPPQPGADEKRREAGSGSDRQLGPPADAAVDGRAVLLPDPAPVHAASIQELLDTAARHHPELLKARARVDEARGQMVQAGLYPNPLVGVNSDNLGDNRNGWGEPGVIISQEFVTANKLAISRAAAAEGVRAADWEAAARWAEVAIGVRRAHADLSAAQRAEAVLRDLAGVAEANAAAASKLLKSGAGSKLDLLRAQAELEQARALSAAAAQRVEAARQLLAVAVGVPEMRIAAAEPRLPAPAFAWQALRAQVLAGSPEVQAALSRAAQAGQLVRRAEAEQVPNVLVDVNPTHSLPENDTRVFVNVGARLPVFNRNQGNIQAARAQAVQAEADVHLAELTVGKRLAEAFQRYEAARRQTEAFQGKVLPGLKESLRLVRLGYEGGDPQFGYAVLLQAQQALAQAELTYVQALGELWRAAADIDGLLDASGAFTAEAPTPCSPQDPLRPVKGATPLLQ
jgi:cobalt-zinc-cadmium efflux system outer membrane protein